MFSASSAQRRKGRFSRTALSLFCLGSLATFGFGGCQSVAPPSTAVTQAGANSFPAQAGGTIGATPASAVQAPAHEAFDGDRAYELLKKQCAFGVRPLGTDAHEKAKDFLLAEMKKYADSTIVQSFAYHGLPVTNIIGVFNPAGSDKPSAHPILLMAHWDTRPIADGPHSDKAGLPYRYGPSGWRPTAPIMGANDAASGAAILLELARIFKDKKPDVGVLLLLDDGEDYGDFHGDSERGDGVELGSRYFAKHYREQSAFGSPFYGILLDMVGAKDATFPREQLSQARAASVNDKVYGIAQSLGYGNIFISGEMQDVNDDHVAINDEGIPMIDIIHPLPGGANDRRAYRYWHTQQDTADKCSPKMLKIVGDVMAEVLYREPR